MKETRFSGVLDVVRRVEVDAFVIRSMDNIFYLTGFRGSEGSLLVTRGDVLLLTDSRYTTYAREVTRGISVVETKEKENTLGILCSRYGIARLAFDSYHTTYQIYQRWKEMNPGIEFVPVGNEIEEIRRHKEPEEILAIQRALRIATEAFTSVFPKIAPGRTEKEIANELDYTMKCLGADSPSFETIVASGPRAALPHAHPTDKRLAAGETVIIDFGCQLDGYSTDETCTVALGALDERMREVYTIVNDARKRGIETLKAGMPVHNLDAVVRGFVEEHGYGDYFRHGTGHGVGIAVHEAPAITPKAEGLLEENMIITVEPGIYLPDVGGVRLEDMVLVRENGCEVLTQLRKDLFEK